MNDKTSRVTLLLAAFLSGLVLFFGAILVFSKHVPSPIGQAVAGVGGPFHLEDQNGKPVTDQDMKGRPFLVFFGFTHCPDICPTTLFDVSQVLKKLGPDADRAGALFITVDPARDTPKALHDYVGAFDSQHAEGLTGTDWQIESLAKRYRVAYQMEKRDPNGNYEVTHSSAVYVFDPQGHARLLATDHDTPDAIAQDLRRIVDDRS